MPREFVRDGWQFMNKCQKPDYREFIKISQVYTGSWSPWCAGAMVLTTLL